VPLVLDTGPLLAFLDAADEYHTVCTHLITTTTEPLLVPGPVLVELEYWLSQRLPPAAWETFTADLRARRYLIEVMTTEDYLRAAEIVHSYQDLKIGLVDASVIAVCERLNEPKVATIDRRHFSVVVPNHRTHLDLLPS